MENGIGVFLVDDHVMVREGLATLVIKDPELHVVGQCGDGLKVLDQVKDLKPDVVVLDIDLPGLSGLDVCREITRRIKGTAVLILTMYDDEQFVARAVKNGASGFLLKDAAADQLTQGIRAVAAGELFMGAGISKDVLEHIARGDGDPYNTLTGRERQVFKMIAENKTNRVIADELSLAVKTVDTHRTRLMRKLGIHNVNDLVKYAIKKGIIPPP